MNEKFIALLNQIKEQYGVGAFSNAQRIKALLMDLAPDMKKEYNLLVNLLNSNAYKELMEVDHSAFLRVLDNMENIYSIKKSNAIWIINAFCSVMNGHMFAEEDTGGAQKEEFPTARMDSPHDFTPYPAFVDGGDLNLDTFAAGSRHTVAIGRKGIALAAGNNDYGQLNTHSFKNVISVSAGENFTVALTSDGKVFACGDNEYGQCEVQGWEGVVAVKAVKNLTVGLLKNNALVFAGKDADKLQSSGKWNDIIYMAVSDKLVAGIKTTGKVVISDKNINVSHWRDMVSVAVSDSHIAGLNCGGRVNAAGRNNLNQCDVGGWDGIVQIAVGETGDTLIESAKANTETMIKEIERIFEREGQIKRQIERIRLMQNKIIREYESLSNASDSMLKALGSEFVRLFAQLKIRDSSIAVRFRLAYENLLLFAQSPEKYEFVSGCHTVGLKSDGTVVATGWNDYGQCDVSDFYNVKKIIAGGLHTLALRYDGTVHFAGSDSYNQKYLENWQNVDSICISKKGDSIFGVSEGRPLNVGNNDCGQCDVDFWEIKTASRRR